MKGKTICFLLILAALCGCRREDFEEIKNKRIEAVVSDFEMVTVKSVISQEGDEPPTFSWMAGDSVAVLPADGTKSALDYTVNGIGARPNIALLGCKSHAFKKNNDYIAYHPVFSRTLTDEGKLPFTFAVPVQTGNGSLDHLAASDFIYAATRCVSNGEALLQFSHLTSLLRIEFSMPVDVTLTKAVIETGDGAFVSSGEFSFADSTVTALETTGRIEMELRDFRIAKNEKGVIWLSVLPAGTFRDKALVITLSDDANNEYPFDQVVPGRDLKSGEAYSIKIGRPIIHTDGVATLSYSEAPGRYSNSKPVNFHNLSGTWTICAYSDGSAGVGFQLEGSKTSYIGTPEFEELPGRVTITTANNYTGDFYICSAHGGSTASSIVKTFKGTGTTSTVDIKSENLQKFWIRSSSQANVSSVEIEVGGIAEGAEISPFTRLTSYGFYTSTGSAAPVMDVGVNTLHGQYSSIYAGNQNIFRIIDLPAGRVSELKVLSSEMELGSTLTAEESRIGSDVTKVRRTVRVVNKSGHKVWLEDKSANAGYIIRIQ